MSIRTPGSRTTRLSRRQFMQAGAAAGALAALNACTPAAPPATPTASAADLLKSGATIPLERLKAEAAREGALVTMALPHDWANYGEMLDTFKKKYGIEIEELRPDGGSVDELDAVRAKRDGGTASAPDTLDIGLGYTASSKSEGILAPYKVATWDTIPDALKDPDGFWFCNYYGVIVFEVNLAEISTTILDWEDLLKPELKGKVALPGDPIKSGQASNSILAAGLSRKGSFDGAAMAGLEFCAELYKAGNLIALNPDGTPFIGNKATIKDGTAPIVMGWDYNAFIIRDELNGSPQVDVIVPRTGVLGGPYASAISAHAVNPFAARLWNEFIFSDEGQLIWLKGYAHPVRYTTLVKEKKVPTELAAKLPPAELYERAMFPSIDQITEASNTIKSNWAKVVLGQG